jgi:hypothetical protein
MGDSKRLDVFTITKKEGQEKGFWHKVGTAFVNKDSSINVFLDALPVNGTLHIREPKEREEDGGKRGNYNQGSRRGEDF